MSSVHVPRPPGGEGGIGGRPEYGGRRQHSPITSSRGARTARSTASKPSSAADQVEYMQTQCDLFTRRIQVEKRRAAELDKKLKISKVKLSESRRAVAGQDDVTDARHRKHKMKTARNRVDHMLKRLNEQKASNEGLKRQIEALRRDKMHMSEVLQKLNNELDQKYHAENMTKRELREAAERRDAAEREVKLLQSTITAELADFEQEFKARIEEGVQDAPPSLEQIQTQAAMSSPGEHGDGLIRARFGGDGSAEGGMSFDQELELRHRSTRSYWEIARREVELATQGQELQQFEDAFAQIQAETGIRTIDEMVSEFVAAEDQNFSLITMINELNQEIEGLEVENAELKAAVRARKEVSGQSAGRRAELYAELKTSVTTNSSKATQYDKQQDTCLRYIDVMKPGIHSLFQKVTAGDDALVESLTSTGVSDSNIMEFLGFIEQRVTQICQLYEMSLKGIPLAPPEGSVAGDTDSPSKHYPPSARSGGALSDSSEQHHGMQSRVGGVGAPTSARAVLRTPAVPSTFDDGEEDYAHSLQEHTPHGAGRRGGGYDTASEGDSGSLVTESTAAMYRRNGLPAPLSIQKLEEQVSNGVLTKAHSQAAGYGSVSQPRL